MYASSASDFTYHIFSESLINLDHIFGHVLHYGLQVGLTVGGVVFLCWRLQNRRILSDLHTAERIQPWKESYPFLAIKHKLREAQGSCTSFWWMVMNHVVVHQGQLKEIFSKGVLLCISLENRRQSPNMPASQTEWLDIQEVMVQPQYQEFHFNYRARMCSCIPWHRWVLKADWSGVDFLLTLFRQSCWL